MDRQRRRRDPSTDESLSPFSLRLALIAATVATVVVLVGIFSDPVRYACLGVVAVAALLTASERRRRGGGWWVMLGAGAGLSLAGAGLAEVSETLGGLIAVLGGVLVLVGATIGFPLGEEA